MKYSVLTYNFDNYEFLREIEEVDLDAEYICVTDNPNLTSKTWKIIYDKKLNGLSGFEKTFYVRYHPFEYVNSDICVKIDGSIKIFKSLSNIISEFINGEYDISLMIHPYRNTIIKEYETWIKEKNYSIEQFNKCYNFIKNLNYDFNIKGLFQLTFCIEKNNKKCSLINNITYNILKYLSDTIERLDQTIYSFVFNKLFSDLKVMPVGEKIIHSEYMKWYGHKTNILVPYNENNVITSYICDKKIEIKTF